MALGELEGGLRQILVIEDEPKILSFVARALSAIGFKVEQAATGVRGLELARCGTYDLVILDLRLPDLDGVAILRATMKANPEQRVLVLSALNDVHSKVRCLELGASDYLPKPFELAELLARVRLRIRQPVSARQDERYLYAGAIKLELLRRIADRGDGPVSLSEREFLLLQHLMRNQGEVCTRGQLLERVWGYSFDPGTNVVDVYVGRLRAKLGNEVIETVRNVGYCLQAA